MSAAIAVLCAVVAVLLAVPRHEQTRLRRRLEGRSSDGGASARRRVVRATSLVFVVVGPATGAGAIWGAVGAVITVSALVVLGTAWRLGRGALRERLVRRAQAEVARACDVLASYLRVGQVATEALDLAARDCPVLDEAAQTRRMGGDVATAWRTQAQRPGSAGLDDLARAWQVAATTGAPLSTSLDLVATGLAADQSLRAVVAGELSAPRATGKVMAVLPLLGLALGYLLGGDPLGWLLAGPSGWICLVLGLVLAAAGVTWIERLARDADGDA